MALEDAKVPLLRTFNAYLPQIQSTPSLVVVPVAAAAAAAAAALHRVHFGQSRNLCTL